VENHIAAIGYFLWQRNLENHHYIWYTALKFTTLRN
jgi:hypothetical protein